MNRNQVFLSVLAGLGFIFVLSLVLEIFLPGRLARVVLEYPLEVGKGFGWEARTIPFTWNKEKNAENLVKEALLGPARPDRLRLFSRDAGLRDVFSRDGTLYVDLTLETLVPDPEATLAPARALDILRNEILFNVPAFKKVEFAFQGQPLLDKFR